MDKGGGKIQSDDIAGKAVKAANIVPGAVHTSKVSKRAITTGKLAVGAVRSNQIADGVVSSRQIGNGVVAPSNLQFPVFYAAGPRGGPAPVTDGPDPYPIADDTWTQNPGQIEVVFGSAAATLAYDGSGSGSCRVSFEVTLNGQRVGATRPASECSTSAGPQRAAVGARYGPGFGRCLPPGRASRRIVRWTIPNCCMNGPLL